LACYQICHTLINYHFIYFAVFGTHRKDEDPMKKRLVVCLGYLLTLSACSLTAPESSDNQIRTMSQAEQKLSEITQDKSCDASYQCRVLAIGEKACGGASEYLIFSSKNTSTEHAEHLASEITSFEQIYNKQNQALATCQHLLPPQTLCINSSCQEYKLIKP
jgi:hypothetical protein